MSSKKYEFVEIEKCNMCLSPVSNHKLLGKRLNQRQGLRPKIKGGISVSIYQCNNCGLIYSNPLPIPNNIQDHYGVPPENYLNKESIVAPVGFYKKELDELEKLIGDLNGKKALDIGAGLGRCMVAMEKRGMDVYGIEASQSFYEAAISKMNIAADKLKCSTIELAEFEPNSYDFVNFSAVLEHFYDPSESILKAINWLKPGGVIFIEVPSSKYLITRALRLYYKLIGSDYVSNISPMHAPFHLYEFLMASFEEHSKINNNIYDIAYHKYEAFSDGLPNILKPGLKWLMDKTGTGMQLCIYLKKK